MTPDAGQHRLLLLLRGVEVGAHHFDHQRRRRQPQARVRILPALRVDPFAEEAADAIEHGRRQAGDAGHPRPRPPAPEFLGARGHPAAGGGAPPGRGLGLVDESPVLLLVRADPGRRPGQGGDSKVRGGLVKRAEGQRAGGDEQEQQIFHGGLGPSGPARERQVVRRRSGADVQVLDRPEGLDRVGVTVAVHHLAGRDRHRVQLDDGMAHLRVGGRPVSEVHRSDPDPPPVARHAERPQTIAVAVAADGGDDQQRRRRGRQGGPALLAVEAESVLRRRAERRVDGARMRSALLAGAEGDDAALGQDFQAAALPRQAAHRRLMARPPSPRPDDRRRNRRAGRGRNGRGPRQPPPEEPAPFVRARHGASTFPWKARYQSAGSSPAASGSGRAASRWLSTGSSVTNRSPERRRQRRLPTAKRPPARRVAAPDALE